MARREIRQIVDYIKIYDVVAARHWFETLQEKCLTLSDAPNIGRIRTDLLPSLYMFPYGNYLIFYDIIPEGIQVIHVIHSARDVGNATA